VSAGAAAHELTLEVRPRWPFRLPRAGTDGVARRRGMLLERLLHVDGVPVVVGAAQPGRDVLALRASVGGEHAAAAARALGEEAIARMRFALAVDDDLRPFWDRFRHDAIVGPSLRARPQLRIQRRPEPFEALAWAICEQLIEFSRAMAIERGIVARLGRRCARSGLRDLPEARTLAAAAPAELEALGLSAGRALALRRAAREVASGRADLRAPDHERSWARLRAIPGIGQWTIDVLALHGQGRYDRVPAGDLAYLKWAGRLLRGRPGARAEEYEVRELLAPYGRWAGLAGAHALRASPGAGSLRATPPPFMVSRQSRRRPRPAGTRW
jgi:3-methyladenine DNA glycosylase/8-oxoguanine DNA glycosylase